MENQNNSLHLLHLISLHWFICNFYFLWLNTHTHASLNNSINYLKMSLLFHTTALNILHADCSSSRYCSFFWWSVNWGVIHLIESRCWQLQLLSLRRDARERMRAREGKGEDSYQMNNYFLSFTWHPQTQHAVIFQVECKEMLEEHVFILYTIL